MAIVAIILWLEWILHLSNFRWFIIVIRSPNSPVVHSLWDNADEVCKNTKKALSLVSKLDGSLLILKEIKL